MKIGAALPLLLLAALVAGCVKQPIYNVERDFPANASASDEEIATLIRDAGQRQGWKIVPLSPGVLRGDFKQGQHRATVEIAYDTTGYSITYQNSAFLKHDGHTIHEAYNTWVKELEAAIDREAKLRLP